MTLKMLEGFKRAGHDQLAVTSTWTDGEFNRRLKSIGIPEVRLPFGAFSKRFALKPMWWTVNFLIRLPWLWFGWSRVLRRFDPDVVVLTSSRIALPVYPWLAEKPSFMIEHSYLAPTRTRRFIYRLLARKLVAFVAVSKFMAGHLVHIGAPGSKVTVIHNGLVPKSDHAKDDKRTAEILSPHRRARIGIVGRIDSNKGHDLLVETLRRLKQDGRNIEVYAFGQGDSRHIAMLSEKLAAYGLTSSWSWKGYESDREAIYQQLDICVMPSTAETFGLAAAEASAREVPVIASNRGGLPEIIEDGVTGSLINPDAPDELYKKLCLLLDNPESARRLGVEARKKMLREYNEEQMIAGYEELFCKAIGQSKL